MSTDQALPTIQRLFSERFARWHIKLPKKAVASRTRGHISKAGWSIQYLFGADEHGEFLDYFSSHRMTDDDHRRIYEYGEFKELEYLMRGYIYNSSVPGDEARAKAAMETHNRETTSVLVKKGFAPMTINSAILMGAADD